MREKLLSLTAKDFRWDYFRGSGKGGQKKNKTSSAVRCTHEPSGAVGVAQDGRSQSDNKTLAFSRCVNTKIFQSWLKIAAAEQIVSKAETEKRVDKAMQKEVKVEVRKDGKWTNEV